MCACAPVLPKTGDPGPSETRLTAPGLLGLASSGFGAELGPKSTIPSRILKSFRGPFSSAEKTTLWHMRAIGANRQREDYLRSGGSEEVRKDADRPWVGRETLSTDLEILTFPQ